MKEKQGSEHNPDMNTHFDNLGDRLRHAMRGSAHPGVNDPGYTLDVSELEGRTVNISSPRAQVQKRVAGLGAGVATLAVAAVVTTSVLSPPAPLFTLTAGGGGVAADGAALAESSDMRMGGWVEYRYLPGDNLSTATASQSVYQLQLSGTPQSVLTTVGQVFGIAGSVEQSEYFDPSWPNYFLGSEDWTSPSVNITWSGTGTWWYSNPNAYPGFDCPASSESPDGSEERVEIGEPCIQLPPEGLLPTTSEAKERAATIFTATGLPVSPGDVRVVYADEWGVQVSAALFVDGYETALEWTISFGPNELIAYASGHSVSAVNRGTFDTVSAYDAVERLNETVWWGSPPYSVYGSGDVTIGSSVTVEPGVVVESDVAREAAEAFEEPTEEPPTAPEPVDPDTPVDSDGGGAPPPPGDDTTVVDGEPGSPDAPVDSGDGVEPFPGIEEEWPTEPEIVEVTVTKASSALLLVFDDSFGAWLVPGFVMEHEEGWPMAVISLVPGVITLPEPTYYDIMPLPEPYIEPDSVE